MRMFGYDIQPILTPAVHVKVRAPSATKANKLIQKFVLHESVEVTYEGIRCVSYNELLNCMHFESSENCVGVKVTRYEHEHGDKPEYSGGIVYSDTLSEIKDSEHAVQALEWIIRYEAEDYFEQVALEGDGLEDHPYATAMKALGRQIEEVPDGERQW